MLNLKATIAGVCAVVASGAGVVAVLEYMDINPFKSKAEVEASLLDETNVRATSIKAAPTIALPAQASASGVEPASGSAGAPPIKPTSAAVGRLTVQAKSLNIVEYANQNYWLVARIEVRNDTDKPLKAAWLVPRYNMLVTLDDGASFQPTPSSTSKNWPKGLHWCRESKPLECWDNSAEAFTLLEPGQSETAILTFFKRVEKQERKPFPPSSPASMVAGLYVVDPVSLERASQTVSLGDLQVLNPNGL